MEEFLKHGKTIITLQRTHSEAYVASLKKGENASTLPL